MTQAADGTWTGASGATWDTSATNWSGVSGTPWDSTNGSGNTALFSTAANATVSGTVYANTITIDALTTLTGGTITLAGSSPTINGSAAGLNIIYSVLAGTNGLTKSGTGTVYLDPGNGSAANTFSGPITINGGNLISIRSNSLGDGAGAITINSGGILNVDWNTVTRTGLVTVNGGTLRTEHNSPQLINNGVGFVLENGGAITTSLAGSGGLTVNGARSYLYSANTYTGATVINAEGDLALQFGGALPTSTALNLSGNLLAGNQNNTVGGLTGASTGRLVGATNRTFTVNKVSGTDSYGGTIENVGTFIKDGAGTLSLTHPNNDNRFLGALTVNNGVLELGGAGRFNAGSYNGAISLSSASSVLQIATSANQTLSGAITGNGSFVKSSTGTNTLSGANSYSGGTTISGGTLVASSANALGDAAGAVTVSTNGVLRVNVNMTRTGTVTVNGGELGSDSGSTLTNNGDGFVLTGSFAYTGLVLAGSGGLTVSSPDARLWTQATYSGATTVTSGQLNFCGSGGISTNSTVSIASGATVDLTGQFAPTDINRTIAGLTGAGQLSGDGGTVTVNKASGTDTFSGVILDGTGLIKDGAGTLVLAGANTYTGNTTVNSGILNVASSGSISSSSSIMVSDGATLRFEANSGDINLASLTVAGTLEQNLITIISSGMVDLTDSILKVNGTPTLASYTLVTGSGLTGTPTLENSIEGYELVKDDNSLKLVRTSSISGDGDGTGDGTTSLVGSTFASTYQADPGVVNPANGLTYLMNYALGGTGPSSTPALPVLTSDGTSLTLMANIRNSGQGVSVVGQYAYDLAGPWIDVALTTGVPSSVANTTVRSFSQDVESDKPRKFLRFKATQIP